jgi:hypothetical protein
MLQRRKNMGRELKKVKVFRFGSAVSREEVFSSRQCRVEF